MSDYESSVDSAYDEAAAPCRAPSGPGQMGHEDPPPESPEAPPPVSPEAPGGTSSWHSPWTQTRDPLQSVSLPQPAILPVAPGPTALAPSLLGRRLLDRHHLRGGRAGGLRVARAPPLLRVVRAAPLLRPRVHPARSLRAGLGGGLRGLEPFAAFPASIVDASHLPHEAVPLSLMDEHRVRSISRGASARPWEGLVDAPLELASPGWRRNHAARVVRR